MNLYLHDDQPDQPRRLDAPDEGQGPTHCATITDVDFDYQAEMWVADIEADHKHVVRVVTDTGREWRRGDDGKFVEVMR